MARLCTGALAVAALLRLATSTNLIVVNHWTDDVELSIPQVGTVKKYITGRFNVDDEVGFLAPPFHSQLPKGHYVVLVVDGNGAVKTYDTNDLQLELSKAAHACAQEIEGNWNQLLNVVGAGSINNWTFKKCVAERTFGGLSMGDSTEAFNHLWNDLEYWRLCEAADPSPAIRTMPSKMGPTRTVEILREKPLVAAIRNFMSDEECEALIKKAGFDGLTMARVGGTGTTGTDENRETLSQNLFVNWDEEDVVTLASVRFFDISSELLGENIPYEGQEPVNFLHYLKGFEYKPHMDGDGRSRGKRVATTLVYCQAAEKGGATVFPGSRPLRFVPGSGDLLFFQYQPEPELSLHAACPVVAGNKTTLTQWYRLGVSPERPWDNFEDWGRFHNVYGDTRWKGPRYGKSPEL